WAENLQHPPRHRAAAESGSAEGADLVLLATALAHQPGLHSQSRKAAVGLSARRNNAVAVAGGHGLAVLQSGETKGGANRWPSTPGTTSISAPKIRRRLPPGSSACWAPR